MINLIANSIDLTRAALDEVLTYLSGSIAVPDSDRGGTVGRLPVTDDRAGVTDAATVFPSPS